MVVLWLSTFWKHPGIGRGYVSGDSIAEKPLVFCHSDVSKGIQPNRCCWVKGLQVYLAQQAAKVPVS